MATPSNSKPPEFSYSGQIRMAWEVPFRGWSSTFELVKEAFRTRAMVEVYSNEIDQILFSRSPELEKRNRHRYAFALHRLSGFLETIGFSTIVRGELIELALALQELDKGIVRDFLKPSVSPKKPESPGDKWAFRAGFCVAVELLCQHGVSRRRASKCVAEVARPLASVVAPNSKNMASTIETWHRQFSSGAVKDQRARWIFERGESLAEATLEQLTKELSRTPSVDELSAKIAFDAVTAAVLAATPDEYDAVYEELRKEKLLREKSAHEPAD